MIIIIGFRKVIASPDKPDRDDKSHLTLWGISDIDHNTNNEDHGPFEWIYVIKKDKNNFIHPYMYNIYIYRN